ncbi:tRNA pseudouridine(38-40) synthase TruA [Arcanobacterium haemolyticum]|nr:tRNA pseudouridine(38-40) synthase TruA [Arcanobacterium haemolyticum]
MDSTVSQKTRLRIDLAYDGTEFHGWAAQPGLRTVEGVLTQALETLLREPVTLTVAGRTDAGVHARGQVVHLDVSETALDRARGRSDRSPEESMVSRLAGILARGSGGPKGSADIVVYRVSRAPEGFDARFSALARSYTYRMCDDRAAYDPLRRRDVLWLPERLDVDAMNRAAEPLLGEHDFLSYCKPRDGATTIRTLQRLNVVRREELIEVTAQADAFCHSMVRTLVGTLIKVGEGSRDEEWPARRLAERSRNGQVVVAAPHPLTLERVFYPDDELLGARARETRAVRECGCD